MSFLLHIPIKTPHNQANKISGFPSQVNWVANKFCRVRDDTFLDMWKNLRRDKGFDMNPFGSIGDVEFVCTLNQRGSDNHHSHVFTVIAFKGINGNDDWFL